MTRHLITRRQFLATSSMAASVAWFGPRLMFGQATDFVAQSRAAGAAAKITVTGLRGGVSVLMGSGGNILVLPGPDGKVMVDSGYATSQPQITAALAGVSSDPLKHLVNTHWHFDHTDGNEWVHNAGASILAHTNTKKRLSTTQTIAAFGVTLPPAPPGAIPEMTFDEKKTVHLNGATLEMKHYDPAHTDSDISVYFKEADVMHLGDTWFNGFYPFIDYSSGGSINGMIAAAAWSLKEAGAKTVLIPGHGPVGSKVELTQYQAVLVAARDRVAAMKKQGKTLDEVVAAKPMADYDATWGAGFLTVPQFLGLVYQGV